MHRASSPDPPQDRLTRFPAPAEQRVLLPSLPVPLTSLVGRQAETAAVCSLLADPDCRLVTLTGPGGIGKTRLALAVAASEPTRRFQVAFLALDGLADPDRVPAALANVLGVRFTGMHPSVAQLAGAVGTWRLLLVLDSFEQVVPAAPLLVDLLRSCPNLTILVTSRVRLRVSGEHIYEVPTLAVPSLARTHDLDAIAAHDAVRLFVARAQTTHYPFLLDTGNAQSVAMICHRLEGLPLAIELAATQSRVFAPQMLLRRLEHRLAALTGGPRDQPTRLQTMRAAIQWSYALLMPAEQQLFRALAVFPGRFSLEAAAAVQGSEVGSTGLPLPSASRLEETLAGLDALVDKSLVQAAPSPAGEPQFGMLDMLREFGQEMLALHDEGDGVRERHARFFIAVAERTGPLLTSPEQDAWLDYLDGIASDLRLALMWAAERGEIDAILRVGAEIWWFWAIRGHWAEGRSWLTHGLDAGNGTPIWRARAAFGLGSILSLQGDLDQAIAAASDALAGFQVQADHSRMAQTHLLLGRTYRRLGDSTAAHVHFDAANQIFRALDDPRWIASALHNLGLVAYDEGHYDHATACFHDALALWHGLGYAWGLASCIPGHLADIARARHDLVHAATLYLEALQYNRRQGDRSEVAGLLLGTALVIADRNATGAAHLLGATRALREQLQAALTPREAEDDRFAVTLIRGLLGDAAFAVAYQTGWDAALADVFTEAERLVSDFLATTRQGATAAMRDVPLLSPREHEVLRLVTEGLTDKEIGDLLGISRRTVSKHVETILGKLGVASRTGAVTAATRMGLLA